MEIFPERLTKLWNEWQLRALVLISLSLQIVLVVLGNRRKYIPRIQIRAILWLAYLGADWIAAVCIGVLANGNEDCCEDKSSHKTNIIQAFWVPFLLLHLGGPDTITAYSMEDNELWLRHFLGLLAEFGGAFYIFLKSWKGSPLNILAIPMFVAGLIKYGERTWALRSASSGEFRKAMLSPPDPGPNYAKIMGQYTLQNSQGFNVSLKPVAEPSTKLNCLDILDAPILQIGYALFHTFKRLFADLILTFEDRERSQSFFHNTDWRKAFNVVEVELGFVYDVLYTKASVSYCSKRGCLLRFVTVSFTISTFFAFLFLNKHGYSPIDLIVTYLLLGGAIVLEIYAILLLLSSDWTMLWMINYNKYKKMDGAFPLFQLPILLPARKRWSDSMAQYNLISYCLRDKPIRWYLRPLERIPCIYEILEKHHYKTSVTVADDLKELIFEHLSEKSKGIKKEEGPSTTSSKYKELCAARGDLVLKNEKYNCYGFLGWSVEEDFDQSILLWHIATDLLYYTHDQNQNASSVQSPDCRTISKMMSDYMLYLLVMFPSMLPNGIGQIRFQDSCAEAITFFQDRKLIKEGRAEVQAVSKAHIVEACQKLLEVNTEVPPLEVKGDKSKSLVFDACRLAKCLRNLEMDEKNIWKMACEVWVEMLCYAACHCGWNQHAQHLRRGGELLTHVWLLMAHFGISEHFKISQGHARSMVVVT